jgi:CubicO group peptidase (beta-lactamase class C family)/D-alanyl-D-alanine dipeptidase
MSRRFFGPGKVLTASILLAAAPILAQAQAPPVIGPTSAYAGVARRLEPFIEAERAQQQIPAVLVVLVDDQETVWSRGFGLADAQAGTPATAETVGRVGSVSKLFTDIAAMQLVEKGNLDLDAPVSTYLPGFQPKNPYDKPITLRQLMSHRAGLVREPPAGHYFDLRGPSLEETVKSLNGIGLVHEPTTRTKYSNAGLAVVGRVIEVIRGKAFADTVKETVLESCGMVDSGFVPTDAMRAATAKGVMWTTDGRKFDAPPFALGMVSAGDLYATPRDLGRFLSMLLAGGQGREGRVIKRETLEAMWQPQFVGPEAKSGFGLGFMIDELSGTRRVGHSGAVYGFATDLQVLPGEKLAAAVLVTKDCANGTARRIADEALRLMRAARAGTLENAPQIETSSPVDPAVAKRVAGLYGDPPDSVELIERNGRLYVWPTRLGALLEVRAQGEHLIVDDPISFGPALDLNDEGLKLAGRVLKRIDPPTGLPAPIPDRWKGLIGEYGWDHNTLYILEKNGALHAQIEWFFNYPLEEVSPDVFRFPDYGMYDNQEVVFERDESGNARSARAAEVVFPRRPLDGEGGRTFRITPARDVEDARAEAMLAEPPSENGRFAAPQLVELTALDPTLKLEIRYATSNNFLGVPVYKSDRAFLQQPAAAALARVNQALEPKGYGLLIHDAYRPWSITKLFRLATPPRFHDFVADPAEGSHHNRGCAVDLTLYDRKSGQPVGMPGGYDEFSPRSNPDYPGGTSRERWHRDLLRHAMEAEGFTVNAVEWWHFDFKDWASYPILNTPFEGL